MPYLTEKHRLPLYRLNSWSQRSRPRTKIRWLLVYLLIGLLFLWKWGHLLAPSSSDDTRHPIQRLTAESDQAWKRYDRSRYTSFRQIVKQYRQKHGRHPPPGFEHWYRFARERHVYLLDDFDQVYGDIRPFWGVEPAILRSQIQELKERADADEGLAILEIRNGSVPANDLPGINWRLHGLTEMVAEFAQYLPDMDLVLNTHDQPRVVTEWADMQALLAKEAASRGLPSKPIVQWPSSSKNASGLPITNDVQWSEAHDLKQFAIRSCPPDSPARRGNVDATSEAMYKSPLGGFITNYTLSTDLCTIGPEVWDKHGILFDALTLSTSQRLLPIFSESKTGVHNDILFPGLAFYKPPSNFAYDSEYDYPWSEKNNSLLWRGTNSGGRQTDPEGSLTMQRSRLVLATKNDLLTQQQAVLIEKQPPRRFTKAQVSFEPFTLTRFASAHADTAFNSFDNCDSNCGHLREHLTLKEHMDFKKQFAYKYLVDVDGHSFSGRWRAFLQSRSLAMKSTIFRDWHDSRLFAWRHFVPLDNRYDELWNILTYFIGFNNTHTQILDHDSEAEKIATQGREWAAKVLRSEDMEVYMFRLLLEYGRVINDDRDSLGYGGSGREFGRFEKKNPFPQA